MRQWRAPPFLKQPRFEMKTTQAAVSSFLVAVSLAISACGDPTSPGDQLVTLSGTVTETTSTGPIPILGARVAVTNIPRFVMSDQNGGYIIAGLPMGRVQVEATIGGFQSDNRIVTLNGDTRLDIQLTRLPAFTLSGVVFEMTPAGQVPVEGVQLYCDSCGEEGHTFVNTDANGFYSFSHVLNGSNSILLKKDGYAVLNSIETFPDGWGERNAKVNGDTRFDIQLVRL
jgi:hypothetical protein